MEKKAKGGIGIDVKSLSDRNLFSVIKGLKESNHPELLQQARKELVCRLKKEKGFNNQRIAKIITANVYGVKKRKEIADEWAKLLGITKKNF